MDCFDIISAAAAELPGLITDDAVAASMPLWNIADGLLMAVGGGAFWLLWQRLREIDKDLRRQREADRELNRAERVELWRAIDALRRNHLERQRGE